MDFYTVISQRRTVREFRTDPVAEEVVRRVLAAGLQAPSNAHLKSWQFIRLRDRDKRIQAVTAGQGARDMKNPAEVERFLTRFTEETLKEVYRRALPVQLTMMVEAPEVLVVCYRMKPLAECRGLFELNPLASVWMCIENIMLALAAEGLYGCTYTPYDAAALKTALSIPPGFEAAAIIPFGYPRTPPDRAEIENLENRLHIDGW